MPSTSACRLHRLMACAASSMNACGLRLKSSSRRLSLRIRWMLRRVRRVRSCSSVRTSGRGMSRSSSITVAAPLLSVACTPAWPMAMSALRHCSRVRGIGARILKRPGALRNQSVIVELNPAGGLVLDAVPQFLELGALENRLARAHPLPLIGVLDVEASRQRAQHFGDFGALCGESLRWREAVVLERLAQGVLDASLRVDVVRPVQVLPDFPATRQSRGWR